MLISFAIENLFKTAIVRSHQGSLRDEFRRTEKLPKRLSGHKLVVLAERAGFSFSDQEEDLLRRLTRNATWAGRYPVPMGHKEMAFEEQFKDGKKYAVSRFTGNDVADIKALVARIHALVDPRSAQHGAAPDAPALSAGVPSLARRR